MTRCFPLSPLLSFVATNGWSLRELCRTLETTGADHLRHAYAALGSAVRAAWLCAALER